MPTKLKRRPNRAMQAWLDTATAAQRRDLASRARTTVNNLFQIAGGHRGASAEMAIKLERANNRLSAILPRLRREDLAPASCGRCDFAKRCRDGN